MLSIKKEDTTLAYSDEGCWTTVAPMVLVYGWGCDHISFKAQAEYFSLTRRVVNLDLRGHGESDAPAGDYIMASYAQILPGYARLLVCTNPSWLDTAWVAMFCWSFRPLPGDPWFHRVN